MNFKIYSVYPILINIFELWNCITVGIYCTYTKENKWPTLLKLFAKDFKTLKSSLLKQVLVDLKLGHFICDAPRKKKTDITFQSRQDQPQHKSNEPKYLEKKLKHNLVSRSVLDSMHLYTIGITKRIFRKLNLT